MKRIHPFVVGLRAGWAPGAPIDPVGNSGPPIEVPDELWAEYAAVCDRRGAIEQQFEKIAWEAEQAAKKKR